MHSSNPIIAKWKTKLTDLFFSVIKLKKINKIKLFIIIFLIDMRSSASINYSTDIIFHYANFIACLECNNGAKVIVWGSQGTVFIEKRTENPISALLHQNTKRTSSEKGIKFSSQMISPSDFCQSTDPITAELRQIFLKSSSSTN